MTTNERLVELGRRHGLQRDAYDRGLSARMVRLLNQTDAAIVDELARRLAGIEERGYDLGRASTRRLNEMLAAIRALVGQSVSSVDAALRAELGDFAKAEAAFQAVALNSAIGAELATLPSLTRIQAIVEAAPMSTAPLAAWVDHLEVRQIERIEGAIRQGLVRGQSIDDMVRAIRGTKAGAYQDGVLQIGRKSCQAMVRTAVTHTSNLAAQETWKANARLLKGWQFVATLDERTSGICGSRDGRVWPIGEGDIPPLHPRCRSITVAVTKSFRELGLDKDELPPGKRASMDGQVAGTTRYEDWLASRSSAAQDRVLGRSRAELFRSGKLSLSDMYRGDRAITLDELKSLYPDLLG